MSSYNPHQYCYITGLTENIDRAFLKNEFLRFGEIQKLYINPTEGFAKVYFKDLQSIKKAVNIFNTNIFGWKVTLKEGKAANDKFIMQNSYDQEFEVGSNTEPLYNVHGDYIETFDDGEGSIYVNLNDIRKTGFGIYTRKDFDISFETKRNIVLKDFYQYMLTQATDYIMKNKTLGQFIAEETILNTIERCRTKLLGNSSESISHETNSSNKNFQISIPNSQENIVKSPNRPSNNKFTSSYNSFTEPLTSMRPPKALPSNFVPTQTQRSVPSGKKYDSRNTNDNKSFGSGKNSRHMNFQQAGYKTERFTGNEELTNARYQEKKHQSRSNSSSSKNSQNSQNHFSSKVSDSSDQKTYSKNLEKVDPIPKVNFEIGQLCDVIVTCVDKEKNNVCWVQKADSSELVNNLLLEIFEEVENVEFVQNVKTGQLALAEYEDSWCRCRVMGTNPLTVFFIDYGNKVEVKEIKELPVKFKQIPAFANRFVINKDFQILLTDEMKIKALIKKKYDDGTYLFEPSKTPVSNENILPEKQSQPKKELSLPKNVEEQSQIKCVTEPLPQKSFMNIPKPLKELKSDDKVMILDLVDNRMAVKTKECVAKSKEILEIIKNLDKSTLLLSEVKENQLVLCCKDGVPNMYRAVVIKKNSPNLVTIKYLDYTGEENFSIKSLRNVNEYLANEPVTMLFTPEMKAIDHLSEKGLEFIGNLCEKKEKAVVVITEDNDFDLKLENGILLTQALLEIESVENTKQFSPVTEPTSTPKQIKPKISQSPKTVTELTSPLNNIKAEEVASADSAEDIVWYDDMDLIKPVIGTTDTYICYTLKDMDELIFISMKDESISFMEQITDLVVEDTVHYNPSPAEMCLVSHKLPEEDLPSWYRGVVVGEENGNYNISMVDFGTSVVVTNVNIRKFPKHLKDIPMLGIFCGLVNIPHNETLLNKIKELVIEGSEVEVTFKAWKDVYNEVELPQVYEQLKKLKLY